MLGSIISAGANIIGGLIGKSSADSAQAQAAQHAARQEQLQREFAQNGIQWRVNDAKAAGIHPIYALGSGGASYSPVSRNFSADTSLPNAMAAAGQDLGRAINSTRTADQRVDAFSRASQALQLEGLGLDNELKRAEVASATARLRSPGSPPFPAPGEGNFAIPGQSGSYITPKALEVTPGASNQPQSEGGAITDVGYARTGTGWAPVPSKDVKERIEDNLPAELLHLMRNNLFPSVGYNFNPPPFKAPEGKEWHFHVPSQEYRLQPKGQGWYERGFTVRDERK